MKTIKWLILILCISCEDGSWDRKHVNPSPGKVDTWTTPMQATIYLNEHSLNLLPDHSGPITRTIMNGTGKSNALGLTDITYSNSSETFIDRNSNSIRVNNGEFEISGNDINSIKGTYQGWGTYVNNEFIVELVMEVTGGTGIYLNSRGNMSATIKPNPAYPKVWVMNINGRMSYEPIIIKP